MTCTFSRATVVLLMTLLMIGLSISVEAAPICAYSGPARNLPVTSAGDLDLKALGTPPYLRIVGCGGGGGGAGAQRSPNTGRAASGAGGAGAEVVSYFYGPTDGSTKLRVEFTSDGAGGCGGAQDQKHCPHLAAGKYAPDGGESGHSGTTVKIGPYVFKGGDPGVWLDVASVSLAGRRAVSGGNGGFPNVVEAQSGSDTINHKGGAVGASGIGPGGHGGIAGGGGGATLAGDGGRGGKAGAGDGSSQGANNNAEDGRIGGVCAGGGGGGGAAGGMFPGGNGGDGGEAWIVIFNIGNKLEYEAITQTAATAEVAMLGYPCSYFNVPATSPRP